jgi:hypothetical protein
MCCTWACQQNRGLHMDVSRKQDHVLVLTCLYYRGLSCTWTCLNQRGLSCTWMCLHHRGLAAPGCVCITGALKCVPWEIYEILYMEFITEFRENLSKYATWNSTKFRGIIGNFARNGSYGSTKNRWNFMDTINGILRGLGNQNHEKNLKS